MYEREPAERRRRILAIVAASSGNLVEWFDSYLADRSGRRRSAIVKAEMFPAEVRALGVGFAYAIGNALFGGAAEYVALAMKGSGHEAAYGFYVTAMTVVFLIVSLRLPLRPRYLDHLTSEVPPRHSRGSATE